MRHIVNESKSPSSEMTTTMWCGATFIELFDGSFTPEIEFVWESRSSLATCNACLDAFERRVVSL